MSGRVLRLAILLLAGLVATLVLEAPANWVARQVAKASGGALVLADAQGSVWQGSAVFSVSGTLERAGTALALPGRLQWQWSGLSPLGLRWSVTGAGVASAVSAELSPSQVRVSAGRALLPCEMLDAAGGMLQTLALRCQVSLGWQPLTLPAAAGSENSGTVTLSRLSSALSPVRPLGDYQIVWHQSADGRVTYQVSTLSGPLTLNGAGQIPGGFRGSAQISPGTPAEVAERLHSLLATLGPVSGSSTTLQY